MTAKWKMEERPVNISNILQAETSPNKKYEEKISKRNIVTNPIKRSAKAKLVNKKCGRLRNFFFRSVAMVREFPTMIRKAITLKDDAQKGFHLLKSILRLNA